MQRIQIARLTLVGLFAAGCGAPAPSDEPLTPSPAGVLSATPTEAPTPTGVLSGTPTEAPTPTFEAVDMGALRLEPNPVNVLSCFALWETDVPATSRITFTDGEETFAVGDDALVTEHRVLVIGMHRETDYTLTAISTAPGRASAESAPASFASGALPEEVYPLAMGIHRPEAMAPGWTLTNNHNKQLSHRPTAVIYDENGEVVWYFVNRQWADDLGSVDTRYTDDGHVLIGPSGLNPACKVTLAGEMVWEAPPQPNTGTDQAHHHCEELPTGDFVTLVRDTQDDRWGDRIVQMSPNYEITWTWNPFDWLDPYGDADWTHNNSVTVDMEAGVVFLNSRNLSKIFKLDRATGAVIWAFGKDGDFAPDPDAKEPWFIFQHDPEFLPNGNILLFDNGNATSDIRPWSRAVEYEIDEQAHTSRIVWQWPGDFDVPEYYVTDFHSPVGGDADRLPNGNTLITIPMRTAEAQNTRIVEVTAEGEIVFEGLLPMTDEWVVGAYRAQRMPALIERVGG